MGKYDEHCKPLSLQQTNSGTVRECVMKPDFSVEWILDRHASALNASAAAFQGGVMRIEHRDAIFRFQLSVVAGDKTVEHAGEGLTDGKEIAGAGALTRLCWDGDALVMSREPQSGDAQ